MANKWHIITGGPSVGKTTLLSELEKLGHATLPEAARIVINRALALGKTLEETRADEYKFQLEILEHKVATELTHSKDLLTFFDRGMHDTWAYMQLHEFDIEQQVKDAMEQARYGKVFLLEPLGTYELDYARTESRKEALKLNELLREAYQKYGMTPIAVPVLPPAKRAEFVLQHIIEPTTLGR